jgi:HK97 family phage portal protein
VSLFTRPQRRSVSYQDVWGADVYAEVANDYATFVPVFAATRLLCDAVAQTPLHAYSDAGRQERQPVFLSSPSARGTRYDWMYRLTYSLLIRGNAFGVITGVGADGWPSSIEWLNPADVSVTDDTATLQPVFTVAGQPVAPGVILHIPAFPLPGRVLGMSPLKAFATTTEVGWQAIRFGRDWFRNNGNPGAILKNTKLDTIPKPATDVIKARFKEAVAARDLLVVGRDWDFNSVSIPAEESQFLATIKATAAQVAAIYGVPPERIGGEAASSRSYANLDMDLRYVRSTSVAGWLTQIEQALTKLAPGRRYVQFNMDANIRADTLTRMQAHEIALRTGIETQDEARAVEDKAPMTAEEQSAWLTAYGPKQPSVPVTREQPQVQPIVVQMPDVDARTFTTVEAPAAPAPAQIHNHVATPDVRVNVEPPQVTLPEIQVDARTTVQTPPPEPVTTITRKTIVRDDSGQVVGIEETRSE